jgi:hypothetical protein
MIPSNPYRTNTRPRTVLTQNSTKPQIGNKKNTLDKPIVLKKDVKRSHIHRYNLRVKGKASKSEEEEFMNIQNCLQKFFDIAIQVDSSSITPPYFELDRFDKAVPDISSKFLISALDSIDVIKRYSSRLSQRNDKGNIYCSVILAQNISFFEFMDKAIPSLKNLVFFPRSVIMNKPQRLVGYYIQPDNKMKKEYQQ